MKAWFVQHWETLWLSAKRLTRNPFANLLNIGVIGIALSLPCGLYVLLANLQGLTKQVANEPQISLFLNTQAAPADAMQIETLLKNHLGVKNFELVPKDRALRELQKAAGIDDVVQSLTQNPLPDAFIVRAKNATAQTLQALQEEFRTWPQVVTVQLDSQWAQRLDALLRLGRIAILLLALLLGFALTAVTFNTIRLQILTQREEIEVAKLIGATNRFIRRPFLYFGTLQGLLGGVACWLIVAASIHILNLSLADLAKLYSENFKLNQLNTDDTIDLLLFSAALGWLGSWMSVSRYLHQIEPH
ncbi:MAG TPA: permease-like cell division protein FtsX [Burkholderiales bacterium]|nr:permease-like cell division protein FtsX [Burkholderiales bacterium]